MPYTKRILVDIARWRGFYPYSATSRRLIDLYNDTADLYNNVKSMPKSQVKLQYFSLHLSLDHLRQRWKLIEYVMNAIFWLNWANLDEMDYKRIKTQLLDYPIYEAWELSSVLSQIDFLFDEIEGLLVVLEVLKTTMVVKGQKFNFYLKEDWNYKVYIEFPDFWIGRAGVPDPANIDYGIKYKCMILVAMLHNQHINMFGNRWKNYTVDELKLMEAHNIPLPTYTRRLIYDPNNSIHVSTTITGDRREGYIDFSGFSHMLLSKLDLKSVEMKLSTYNYKLTYVSSEGD